MRVRLALWLLAVGLTVAATLAIQPGVNDISATEASFLGVFAFAFAAAGLIAWSRRPSTRLGPLLTLFAFSEILSAFQQSRNDYGFTFGYLIASIPGIMLAQIALAYPTGRLQSRLDRRVLTAAYLVMTLTYAANLLVYDSRLQDAGVNNCHPRELACPESVIAAAPSREAFAALQPVTGAVMLAAELLLLALIVRRYLLASRRARRSLAPIVAGIVPVFFAGVALAVAHFATGIPSRLLFLSYVIATAAFVGIVIAGMLRTVIGRGAVGTLLVELEHTPTDRLRGALSKALDDPTLELRFWLPERSGFVDESGAAAKLPEAGRDHAITVVEAEGQPLAALVHDPALRDDPVLLEAATAAARLALENARLQAQLSAQLLEVQESRARIVAAGDDERRRLERNIHDGAQQRLVSLALSLRIAERTIALPTGPTAPAVLANAVTELQEAVAELRELARGLHPSLLAEDGLVAALEALADRTPVPVSLDLAAVDRRLAPEIELSAYFVACEAVANAVKHAHASSIRIEASRRDGTISIEVVDDGIGGADAEGAGLRGLADRVAAHGGLLCVESGAGNGTRVVAELPCAP